jgi:hypothetical protein
MRIPSGSAIHISSKPHGSRSGARNDLNPGRLEALVFGGEIPDLNPDSEIASSSPIADTGDLEVTSAEKENKPTELAVDGKDRGCPGRNVGCDLGRLVEARSGY